MRHLALFLDYYNGSIRQKGDELEEEESRNESKRGGKPKPDFYWLTQESWAFFLNYEEEFEPMKGRNYGTMAKTLITITYVSCIYIVACFSH